LENIVADEGIVTTEISQVFFSEQNIDAVTRAGVTSEVISKISNIDKADVDKALVIEQKQTQEEIGTIDAVGTAISDILGSMNIMIVAAIVAAVIVIFIVMSMGE